jgi:hypothetical protein
VVVCVHFRRTRRRGLLDRVLPRRDRRRRYGCADMPGYSAAMFDVRDIRRVDGALVLVTYRGDW